MAQPKPLDAKYHAVAAQIAAATRLLVMEEILDYSGHISVRVPGEDALLIPVGSHSRAEASPEAVLLVGFDGEVRQGRGKPPSELAIHTEILKARPDVNGVLHCHMEMAIAFTMMEGVRLLPMRAQSIRWKSGIPIHPDPGHIFTVQQGREVAASLAGHNAVLMRAHGLTMVSESAPALLVDAVHFKENARAHMTVLQAGCKPMALTEAEMAQIAHQKPEIRANHVRKLWNYYVRRGWSESLLPAEWPLLEGRAD